MDRGYRSQTTAVYIASKKRRITPALRRDLRRRSAIESAIGRMKADGCVARCAYKVRSATRSMLSSAAADTTSS